MSDSNNEQRLLDLERRLDELSKDRPSRPWFDEPAWWGVMIALIAVLASLYAPVWKPLFSNHDHTVAVSNALVTVTPQNGVLWLAVFVTVSNPTSSVVYLDRVQANTTYKVPGKGRPALDEGILCPVVSGSQDAIPPHDSIQYSAQYLLAERDVDLAERSLQTTIVVRPAYGFPETTAPLKTSEMVASSNFKFQYQCPNGTLNNGTSPLPSAGFRSPG